ncbi:MAG: hypothetical protein HYY40_14835 [Bacteroidetes bacterium]|nr:hypothetical protein [Bacteroidota bacterium]
MEPVKNQENTETERIKEKFTNRMFALAAGMLFLVSVVLGWLFLKERAQSEKALRQAQEEKIAVKSELRELLTEYEGLKTQNSDLNAKLTTEREKISEMIAQIDKLKVDSDMLYKYKKEASALRKLIKVYLRQVDSLNTSIKVIKEEKEAVEVKLTKEKKKTEQLTTEKEQLAGIVETGSKLNTYDVTAIGVRYGSGGEREKPIKKARKTERIKTCFKIGENAIAKAGQKTAYLRIAGEDGKVFPYKGDSANVFEHEGKMLAFSAKKDFEYTNVSLELCVYFDKPDDLKPGKYSVDIFCEGAQVGEAVLELE